MRDEPSLKISTDSELPKGKIYIKGNSVFKGYFKNPKLTNQKLDSEGWLSVGDIGVLNKNGSISVIDRTDDITKLQNGQFITPLKLENIYITCPLIKQIYVDINPNSDFLLAIVYLDDEKLRQYADVNGLSMSIKELLKDAELKQLVLKQLERAASLNKLDEIEEVKDILILQEPFSVKNSMLTDLKKLRRKEIKSNYEAELN